MNMKMIGIPADLHNRITRLKNATGIMIYRLIQEMIENLEEKYKDQLEKYNEQQSRSSTTN